MHGPGLCRLPALCLIIQCIHSARRNSLSTADLNVAIKPISQFRLSQQRSQWPLQSNAASIPSPHTSDLATELTGYLGHDADFQVDNPWALNLG